MNTTNPIDIGLLKKLPPPPAGKAGFPWTEESELFALADDHSTVYPKISIVTPSYNQGQFLEETIRSVLLQNYPNLEYIIIDGGSTDNSINIIKKYEDHLTYWVSEKDSGQSNAINKALKRISGKLWAYINSDDVYEKGVFYKVAQQFIQNENLMWVTGQAEYTNERGEFVESLIPNPFAGMKETLVRWECPRAVAIQVSNFMATSILEKYGYFDESLHYCMDAEFGMRLLMDNITPIILPEVLAKARLHSQSKTVSKGNQGVFDQEDLQIARKFLPLIPLEDQRYVQKKIAQFEYFSKFGKALELYEQGERGECFAQTLKLLFQHPTYLTQRATWGLFRRLLGLQKTTS